MGYCETRVAPESVYGVLHRECFRLFPDEMFADLFTDVGRRSVPPMIVAVVMVLQRIEGLSDREAVDRFSFDARWKYAAGGLDFDYPGFVHTVLVDMRARLAASLRPDRIFEVTLGVARAAGLVGRRRVLDSTPLYDAVATMDTVTLIRSAIRGLLRVADADSEGALRGLLSRDDDYASAGRPVCDWDDRAAREALVDALARDARALLGALDGRELSPALAQAAALLATVVGQDLEQDTEGVFRIARRVARDRVISTVDPEARHGRKTSARGFDGYKGHIGIDPDSEIITATTVSAGNAGDATVAEDLIADLHEQREEQPDRAASSDDQNTDDQNTDDQSTDDQSTAPANGQGHDDQVREPGEGQGGKPAEGQDADDQGTGEGAPKVYGDCAYGCGEFQAHLEDHNIDSGCKTQAPAPPPGGLFSKSHFGIDLGADTVSCPGGVTVAIHRHRDGSGTAAFGPACAECPLRTQCTTSATGRTVTINTHEDVLTRARARQSAPGWQSDYQATRPKVERKFGHLMRRKHGGRHARVRGRTKVDADFRLLAAATNLARLAVLGLHFAPTNGWTATT